MKFGDWITFDAMLKRVKKKREGEVYKSWEQEESGVTPGIFLGYRTLANGYRGYDSEDGVYFIPKEYFRAALVAFSSRHNPVLVPLDRIDETPL